MKPIKRSTTDNSFFVMAYDEVTGQPKTGIAYGSVSLTDVFGGTKTTNSATSLGSLNASHSDHGWYEVDATNTPGLYRVDWRDAPFGSGSHTEAILYPKVSGVRIAPILVLVTEHSFYDGKLPAAGVDSIVVESGGTPSSINLRQAIALILAGAAGELSGAAGTSITIKAASVPATTRIASTVDTDGNRSSITLTVPS